MKTIKQIAEEIANDAYKVNSNKFTIASAVNKALYAERERAAKIVNDARFEDEITDLRQLVSRIRSEP